jgi:uncharacterized protein YhdP
MIRAVSRVCWRSLYWLGIALFSLFVVAVLVLRYWLLPSVPQYRADIEAAIEQAIGADVSIGAIESAWVGRRPVLKLVDLSINDQKGLPALALGQVNLALSWWTLASGRPQLSSIVLVEPHLKLRRGADGAVYFADLQISGGASPAPRSGFLDWLLEQPNLSIVNAKLEWHDQFVKAAVLRLAQVNVQVSKVGERHQAGLTAQFAEGGLAQKIDIRTDVAAVNLDGLRLTGNTYVAIDQVDIVSLKHQLPYAGPALHEAIAAGRGNVRAWVTLEGNRPRGLTVDVAARDALLRLPDASKPLDIVQMRGRVEFNDSPTGYRIATDGLDFTTRDGLRSSGGKFALSLTPTPKAPGSDASRGFTALSLEADGIDLAVVAALAEYVPITRAVREKIASAAPRGVLKQARVAWQRSPTGAQATQLETYGRLENFGVNTVDGYPAVAGLTATWKGNEDSGSVEIDSQGLTFLAPLLYETPLKFDRVVAAAVWSRPVVDGRVPNPALPAPSIATTDKVPGRPVRFDISQAQLTSADADLTLAGTYTSIAPAEHRSPGWVDMRGTIKRADAARIHSFLPSSIPDTRAWLERSLTAGKLDNGSFRLKGDLWHFPFADPKHGEFSVDANLAGVRLKFLPDWPALEDLKAKFEFRNANIKVIADRATYVGAPIDKATAQVSLTGSIPFSLKLQAKPDAQAAYRVLRESPLRDTAGKVTEVVQLKGKGELDLEISVPLGLEATERLRLAGRYALLDADARISPQIALTDANGAIRFSEEGIVASEIQGRMFAQPAKLALSPTAEGVRAVLDGRVQARDLTFLLAPGLLAPLTGDAAWRATFLTTGRGTLLRVESNLVGMASAYPAPLAKRTTDAMPLLVDVTNFGVPEESLRVRIADRVGIWLYRDLSGATPVVRSAAVQLGQANPGVRPPEPPGGGLWISGSLPFIDFDEWRRVTQAPTASVVVAESSSTSIASPSTNAPAATATDSGLDLNGVDIATGRLRFFGQEYAAVTARLARQGSVWSGRIASPDIEGEVHWDGRGSGGRGALRANLTRLHILPDPLPGGSAMAVGRAAALAPARDGAPRPMTLSLDRAPGAVAVAPVVVTAPTNTTVTELPSLDIRAQSFRFRQQWLGALELKATPLTGEWKIDRFAVANGHSRVEATGGWRPVNGQVAGSSTRLEVTSTVENLNALFAQFGHGDALKRGSATMKGTLSWPGYPQDFALTELNGDLRMDWRDGQFAKLEPGFGRLLGLISLQSVPRRFTLDFRDIFSEGFAFDRITGDIKLSRGVMTTENFEVAGPAAFVSMQGEVSLPAESQNLRVRVVPEVGEGVAIAATIIGTPVIGLTTLLVQKLLQNPLNRIVAYEYTVSGTWDSPVMLRSGQTVPAAAAPPQTVGGSSVSGGGMTAERAPAPSR